MDGDAVVEVDGLNHGKRLVDFLHSHYRLASRSQAKRLTSLGRVLLNGEPSKVGAVRLETGDCVALLPPPQQSVPAASRRRQRPEVRVLLDVGGLLVVWKPAGLKLRGTQAPVGIVRAEDENADDLEAVLRRRRGGRWLAVVEGSSLPKAACGLVVVACSAEELPVLKIANQPLPQGAPPPKFCPDCSAPCCLLARAIVCGRTPERFRLADGSLVLRIALTPSNRHGFVSTVVVHSAYVATQHSVQDALRDAGHTVCNDRKGGKAARVSRVRGLCLARVGVCIAGRGILLTVEEPRAFALVRRSEECAFEARRRAAKASAANTIVFGGLEISCPIGAALRPRLASETLVAAAFSRLAAKAASVGEATVHEPLEFRVLDLGTGTACLLLALLARLANELPGVRASGVGVDRSDAALVVAAANCMAHSTLDVALRSGEFATFGSKSDGTFDCVLCNPPYLDERTACLDSDVADPSEALFYSEGGLGAYRELFRNSNLFGEGEGEGGLMREGGFVAIEVGAGASHRVRRIFEDEVKRGWGVREALFDSKGMERCLVIERQ